MPHTHIQWTSVRYQCLGMDKCYWMVEKISKILFRFRGFPKNTKIFFFKCIFFTFLTFFVFFGKNRKFRFWSYLPTDVSFHLSHQPGWSDEYGVRSFKSCKKSFEKIYFRIFGKSPKSRQNFWIFFYQWKAFIHTKTLIPHWSSLDMCMRQSSGLRSKSVKIRMSSKPPLTGMRLI